MNVRVTWTLCLFAGAACSSQTLVMGGSGGTTSSAATSTGTGGTGTTSSGTGGTGTTSSGTGGAGTTSSGTGGGGGGACGGSSAPPCPLWSKRFGDVADQDLAAMAGDPDGNLYLLGTFTGSIDFGGGALTSTDRAVFVAKLDAAGNHVWSKAIRSLGTNGFINPAEIAVDAGSNLVVAGDLVGPVDLGEGMVTPPDPGNGYASTFIAKYDAAAGDLQWARFPGVATAPGNYGQDNCVALGPGGAVHAGIESSGPPPTFLSMLDPAGSPAWSATYSGSIVATVRPLRVATDAAGGPVVVGQYSGNPDLGGGALPNSGGFGLFLADFSTAGAYQWAHGWSGFSVTPNALAIDPSGDVYVTGHFSPPMDFGNGSIGAGIADQIFLLRVSPSGSTVWSKAFTDSVVEMPFLALASNGNVLLAGDSYQPVDFVLAGGPGLVTSSTCTRGDEPRASPGRRRPSRLPPLLGPSIEIADLGVGCAPDALGTGQISAQREPADGPCEVAAVMVDVVLFSLVERLHPVGEVREIARRRLAHRRQKREIRGCRAPALSLPAVLGGRGRRSRGRGGGDPIGNDCADCPRTTVSATTSACRSSASPTRPRPPSGYAAPRGWTTWAASCAAVRRSGRSRNATALPVA